MTVKTEPDDVTEVRRLRAAWDKALTEQGRHNDGPDWAYYDGREQAAWDALIEAVEAADLAYTEHDPRDPRPYDDES